MRNVLIFFFIYGKLFSQVLFNPASTIACNSINSYINFTITTGNPPFTFTVQPPCAATYTTSSQLTFFKAIALNCVGVYTITVQDASNIVNSTITHSVNYATNWKIPVFPGVPADTICLGTNLAIRIEDSTLITSSFTFNPVNWSTGQTTKMIVASPSITTTYSVSGLFTASKLMNVPITRTCTIDGAFKIAVASHFNGVDCTTGFKENELINSFKIYPNPVTNVLNLDYDERIFKVREIFISNMLGQSVKFSRSGEKEIDLSVLTSGIYFLKLSTEAAQITFKIIKK